MITIKNETGSVFDTKVIAEDAADLTKALAITDIVARLNVSDGMTRASVELALVGVEVSCGKVEWLTKHPVTGVFAEVSFIRFADGHSVELRPDGSVISTAPNARDVTMLGSPQTIKLRAAPGK